MRGRRSPKFASGTSRLPDDDYKPNESRCMQDGSFLDIIHPIEAAGMINNKELTPIQKAITFCIMDHGGSASENEILDFVTKKWKLINEKSIRQFQVKPCMRLIRLNLSIKKANQQLFLPDPEKPGNMILGSYDPTVAKHEDGTEDSHESPEIHSSSEEIQNSNVDFTDELLSFMVRSKTSVKFDEILNFAKTLNCRIKLFSKLKFDRQIRAILISLKTQGLLYYNPFEDTWSHLPSIFQK